jgi:hypothetical protein
MTKDLEKSKTLGRVAWPADAFDTIVDRKMQVQAKSLNIPTTAIVGIAQNVQGQVFRLIPNQSLAIDYGPEQQFVFESSPAWGGSYNALQLKPFAVSRASQEQSWTTALNSLQLSLQTVNEQLASLREELRELRGAKVFGLEITTLAPEPFEILRPIPVTIEGVGDNFTATYFEGNVSASGDTESDAIVNFKDSLISKYEILESTPENILGPLPQRQWQILRTLIRRVD